MDSLESFVREMLDSDQPKELFLQELLKDLEEQQMPSLEQAKRGYARESNLHGINYDYETQEVTVAYRVVPDLHPSKTVAFAYFETIVEGLLCCRRKRKWQKPL